MTAVKDLSVLAERHETISGSAGTVAGGAERRNMSGIHKPAHNLIQSSLIRNIELLRVMRTLFLGVAANRSSGTAGNLRNSHSQKLLTHRRSLSCGYDHSGIRHCQADAGRNFCKDLIADSIIKHVRVNVVGLLHSRNTDGMRTNPMNRLKVLGMHDKSRKLIFIHLKSEKHTQTHIIDATLHGAVHSLCVISVIVLWPRRMKCLIALLVVSLLEQNIGSDTCLLELSVILNRSCCDVDINTANVSVFVMYPVDSVNAFENVLDGIVHGILSGLNGETLVTHILEGNDLCPYLLLCELLSCYVFVF